MNLKIAKLKQLIHDNDNIVFFGGAGVSTKSGIPDFRSTDGLYNKKYKYPPETILSHSFFVENPDEFYEFYRNNMFYPDVLPNITHYTLAKLEQIGKISCVITQNIDGLHQKAGSKKVIELHGSVNENYCTKCKARYNTEYIMSCSNVPRCECGGIIRPNITLYEEYIDTLNSNAALDAIINCELLIVAGTSLTVRPASSYLTCFKGKNLVIINKDFTKYDHKACLLINEDISTVFSEVIKDYT